MNSSIPFNRLASSQGGSFSDPSIGRTKKKLETQIEREISCFIQNLKSMADGELIVRLHHNVMRLTEAFQRDRRDGTSTLCHEWAGMGAVYDELQRRLREAKP